MFDQPWLNLAYALGVMALVVSGVLAQRLRLGQVLRYGLIWAAITAALVLGYNFRERLGFSDPFRDETVVVPRSVGPVTDL